MNPWLIGGLLVAFLGASAGSFKLGMDHVEAGQAREDKLVQKAIDASTESAAKAIAAIKVKNTTVQQIMQKEIYEKPVYRDCRNTPDGMRAINSALVPGDSKLPTADAAK
ncbi:hypothetical protein PQR63_23055 [Herbaspirillum rhizosphaerae]|uniref:Uncharacterized protein n=1 Tax=Herbaspirillum rhizosphaerae TaxID=346179 RepID=A0ABW8ZFG2_9BURK